MSPDIVDDDNDNNDSLPDIDKVLMWWVDEAVYEL
jgi:hypothetical protein